MRPGGPSRRSTATAPSPSTDALAASGFLAPYVAEHVELAYAQTCHASQGRTVDRSFLYLDAPTGAAGIYVPMTRGRESNEAFVVIRGEETPSDVVAEALTRTRIDRLAVAVRAELRSARSTHDERRWP